MDKIKDYKYLTILMLIGFGLEACIGVVAWTVFNQTAGFSIGASFWMLIGIMIGTVIDYEIKDKK